MIGKHFAVIVMALSLSALAACKPEKPVAAAAPAAVAAPVAVPVAEITPASTADFDMRAFAGEFGGTLPCADCPGIETRIELKGDGSYALDETYVDRKDGRFKGDGSWTVEENGHRLRLDPNSKSEQDRLFEIVGNDEIRMLGKDGEAVASGLDRSLKRTSTAQ